MNVVPLEQRCKGTAFFHHLKLFQAFSPKTAPFIDANQAYIISFNYVSD